ncbi:ComEC/Rec2 family competence protein [Salicola sp. Rm-C-2C1-2]|uniref:ComEC/Rec2 family competence protein n=1 Tax=Salicola sp. Rm-C-2C1-2 TaxID=3141321 RepID=UPI0032E41A54
MEWSGGQPPATTQTWPESIRVKGYVCEPASASSGDRLAFVLCTGGDNDELPKRIRATFDSDLSRHSISGGVVLDARLRPPRAPLNAGGGGFERWLWRERVGAVAAVSEIEPAPELCGLSCHYHSARIALIHRLNHHGERLRFPELVEALLLGSRAGLNEEHWARLQATGAQHLVAISGLHVGLVAALAGVALGLPLTRIAHQRPAASRLAAFALVGLVAAGYALLAGFTVPTQRALVMVVVAAWMLNFGRQWRLWDGWLLAVLIVVMLEPRAPWGPGFWLSFGAVACLILGLGARLRGTGALLGLMLAQVSVVAGLAPLLLWHGMAPSGIAFAVNLVAIPWLSVVVMPVLLIAAPLLLLTPETAGWAAPGVDLAVTVLWSFLGWAQQGAFELPLPAAETAVLAAGIVLCTLLPVGWPYRLLAVLVLTLVPLAEKDRAASVADVRELRIPDGVGGPVVLIRDGTRTILFDGREPDARVRAITRDRIGSWLEALDVERIDHLVMAHPAMTRQHHWRSPRLPKLRHVTAASECETVQAGAMANVTLSGVVTPEGQCSLLLRSGERTALLSGPVTRRGERRLLPQMDDARSIGMLLAPRGGQGRSSQLGFIKALSPEVSVLAPPDWYQGRAGAPAIKRYQQAQTRVLFTPHTGEIRLVPEQAGWRVEYTRDCGQKARLC